MDELSFEKLPHYNFSANRQFEPNECHMNRIYEFSVLILMRKGILRFTEGGVPIELNPGEYYIQKAHLYQQGLVPSDEPNYYFIHFRGHYNKGSGLPIRGTFDIDAIQQIILQMEALGTHAARIEYEQLFYTLLCALKHSNSSEKRSAEQIRTYLLEHYTESITLKEISKIFYWSPNKIIALFKEYYGETPYQMLLSFRLKRASEYILSSDAPIQQIALDAGFKDYTAFYKSFSKKFGMSPLKYRAIHSTEMLPDLYFTPGLTDMPDRW